MSIRDELAEVIFNRSNVNGETYVDTLYQHEAYAFSDAVLEHFAVVELPEPDEKGEYAARADGKDTLTSVKMDSAYYAEPMVALDTSSVRTFFRAERAREVAGALLAAAARAEAQS